MGIDQKALGQDTTIELLRQGAGNIKKAKATNWTSDPIMKLLEERYVGDRTKTYDCIYEGQEGAAKLHISGKDLLLLKDDIVKRAKREIPHFIINAVTVIRFPEGDVYKEMDTNVFFTKFGRSVPAGGGHVEVDVAWKASSSKVLSGN